MGTGWRRWGMWTAGAGLVLAALAGCGGSGFDETRTLNAGLKAQAAGQLAVADADYLAVVKHDDKNKLAWYDLGVIAQQHQEAQSAQHDYLQALAVDPRYVPALYNLALVETPYDPTTAVKLYQQVVAIEPADAAAHYNLGTLLVKQGQATEGEAQITTAKTLDPSLNGK